MKYSNYNEYLEHLKEEEGKALKGKLSLFSTLLMPMTPDLGEFIELNGVRIYKAMHPDEFHEAWALLTKLSKKVLDEE
jgi:hypothetical protein